MSTIQSVFQDPVFDALENGELTWGDLLPPVTSETDPAITAALLMLLNAPRARDFSSLAGRKNRNGSAFASAAARRARISLRQPATQPEYGPEPSVPGWEPAEWDAHSAQSFEEEDRGCEGCGKMRCECCDGCYPGCAFCVPDFDPADPYGDGAPEEHPGHPGYCGPDEDWEPSDDEYEMAFLAALCR